MAEKMEVKEALELLSNGHMIISPEAAEEVCRAVGVAFDRGHLVRRWHSDPPGTVKGLTMTPEHEGSEEVYTLELSEFAAKALGVAEGVPYFHGRGFQARAYAEAVAWKLGVSPS